MDSNSASESAAGQQTESAVVIQSEKLENQTVLVAERFGGNDFADGYENEADTRGRQRPDDDGPRHERFSLPMRPFLRRDQGYPDHQIPPPSPQPVYGDSTNPNDSLSLLQLRKLVTDVPNIEPRPYAFVYTDASTLEEELDEWFTYSGEDRNMLLAAESSYAEVTKPDHQDGSGHAMFASEEGSVDWTQLLPVAREKCIRDLLSITPETDLKQNLRSLGALVYLALGCWKETSGVECEGSGGAQEGKINDFVGVPAPAKNSLQMAWIRRNVRMICDHDGVNKIFAQLRASCLAESLLSPSDHETLEDVRNAEAENRALWCSLTLMYVVLEICRVTDANDGQECLRQRIIQIQPNLLVFLTELIARLRWDESIALPLNKIILLTWKAFLVVFGGIKEVEQAKKSFRDESMDEVDARGQPVITASPLDYHLFRQEISSKYPAYNPPPPLFPLEPENNSILPPLHAGPGKFTTSGAFSAGLANLNGNGTSILHQPVHIATPAPSPPPSPAGTGGKGGKKQNYQTNQLFPFLYPPLDEYSNSLGGKGTAGLQDALVGRKWEGSDIPASILEAAELFAGRMRATRAMRQLWDERVQFMKYERGWDDSKKDSALLSEDLNGLPAVAIDQGQNLPTGDIGDRLQAVEIFYKNALPHMQSLVIVLLKVILSHVTALITQLNSQNGLQSGFQPQDPQSGVSANKADGNGGPDSSQLYRSNLSNEELDAVRTQEIIAKGVSGILILLLKWFKVSHILKFEYLSQLLLDSNYIPLILKLLQSQELERMVNYKCDRDDLSFLHFCRMRSKHGSPGDDTTDFEDDAAPPPVIRLRRDDRPASNELTDQRALLVQHPPEVDELGFPTSELPSEPITDFSWRIFFSNINYLRIMQKLSKHKAHRNLLLVQYKSSQFLKKCLKVPQPELRLYTLKLFKNQVPYCGRKWRQSNMRVITAVYLHCRPELRDDWLAGSDVDAEIEEALPLEQALRALTHWHNLRRYAEKMGADRGILEEEQDFFVKELQKMDWAEDVSAGEEGTRDQTWDGPLQMDGWLPT